MGRTPMIIQVFYNGGAKDSDQDRNVRHLEEKEQPMQAKTYRSVGN